MGSEQPHLLPAYLYSPNSLTGEAGKPNPVQPQQSHTATDHLPTHADVFLF